MLNLVGSPPSSGSTFFADLLDSTPYTACGEEINIFSTRKFYDFQHFKAKVTLRSLSSLYLYSEGINWSSLCYYGMDRKIINELFDKASTPMEFGSLFAKYYLVLRGKDPNGHLFEKTPQNILCIEEFLNTFPESYFIYIVRDPLYTYSSMRKRGFSPYLSAATWFLESSRFLKWANHPRVIWLRYEDLVQSPYDLTASILKKTTGLAIDPADVEKNFKSNNYRKIFSIRLPSWGVQKVGQVVNANKRKISPDTIKELAPVINMNINSKLCELEAIPGFDYSYLLDFFGYSNTKSLLKRFAAHSNPIAPNINDLKRLTTRWLLGIKLGEAKLNHLSSFLRPIY